MICKELQEKIRSISNYDNNGRYDLLSILSNAALFSEVIKYFSNIYKGKIDYIASPEATGWILGAALASELNVGFIELRKRGKLPYTGNDITSVKYPDYSNIDNSLEIRKGIIPTGSNVLIVDDCVITGATICCCIELLMEERCTVSGLATISINENENTKLWIDTGFATFINIIIPN